MYNMLIEIGISAVLGMLAAFGAYLITPPKKTEFENSLFVPNQIPRKFKSSW